MSSILLIIFGIAAYAILGLASMVRGEETTQILDLNTRLTSYANYVSNLEKTNREQSSQMEDLMAAFKAFDVDGSGAIVLQVS